MVHILEYYSAVNGNEILINTSTWMDELYKH